MSSIKDIKYNGETRSLEIVYQGGVRWVYPNFDMVNGITADNINSEIRKQNVVGVQKVNDFIEEGIVL